MIEHTPERAPARPRVLAVTSSNAPVTLTYARLVDALRRAGAEVRTLPVPTTAPHSRDDRPPNLSDLKAGLHALAESVTAALGGERGPASRPDWLISLLRTVEGTFDAVVAVDPRVARDVFPAAADVWPSAVRVAVDGDLHVDQEWHGVEFDDLVTPHPALGRHVPRIQAGQARLRTGGPVVAPADAEPRRLAGDRPMVVVSFARLGSGHVDPLLFQLSLARPETFSLLLLPSGRAGIDELVRTRASGYGLEGKRPKRSGSQLEAWVRGAAVLVGHPSPAEAAAALTAEVPQLLFVPGGALDDGDAFMVQHGLAQHAPTPLSIAIQLEALLPGGSARGEVAEALSGFETDGTDGAAAAVLEATSAGRPTPEEVLLDAGGPDDDELEDIGGAPRDAGATVQLSGRVQRAYLKEIVIQLKLQGKQLARARAGHDRWKSRLALALRARDARLTKEARVRVDGLERIMARLQREESELTALRDRFSGRDPVSAGERERAARFMSPEVAATLDQVSPRATDQDFTTLEVDDALGRLKRRMDDVER